MRFARTIILPSRTVIAALLALAILCAQWVGVSHRIAHAGLQQPAFSSAFLPDSQANESADRSAEHSCLLLDAAALSAALGTPPLTAAVLPGAPVLALWLAFASWDAPLLCHFSSRAPPRI